MVPADNQEAYDPFLQAVQAQLSDLPVDFQVLLQADFGPDLPTQEEAADRIASETGAAAVVWCDFTQQDRTLLYLAVPEIERVIERRLEGSGSGGISESLGIIVRTSIETILRGQAKDLYADKQEPTAKEDVQTKPPPSEKEDVATATDRVHTSRFSLKMALALEMFSKQTPIIPGGTIILDAHLAGRWHAVAGYTLFPSTTGTAAQVELTLVRYAFGLGLAYVHGIGRFDLGAMASVGFESAVEIINASKANMLIDKKSHEFGISLIPCVSIGYRITSQLKIFADMGVDVRLNKVNYILSDFDQNSSVVLATWRARPVVRLGIAIGSF